MVNCFDNSHRNFSRRVTCYTITFTKKYINVVPIQIIDFSKVNNGYGETSLGGYVPVQAISGDGKS